MSKESARKEIEKLIDVFEEHYNSYHATSYDEAKTRLDFINKFFKAFGWDVDNEAGAYEAYREVVVEDRFKAAGRSNAPDYMFRLSGGKKLFFVEAKKPTVKLKTDSVAAYQLRGYGRSAQLPVSILTNFEEFAVYDCTRRPSETDSSSIGRLEYLTYKEYLNKFDFLYDT
ncbi:MAG TPA: hypothetical protein PLD84_16580, partial [Chitinophagales bacterium]|nr:hypothetical protein [Chitinophagales bacterium]